MNTMLTTEKSIKKGDVIEDIIREKIIEVMREILSDPDYGLELRQSFVKRLKKSIEAEKKGKLISLSSILKKYKI
ncbi:hypothetical protein KJ636_05495 [Patescibacteria group bacterium]|nr:hypothetical protein [Patescibacteria group bacterium]MBU4481185.1 hypothetical protein [Patescibacteria group bacterium]